jgi:hypothetical protein
MDLLMSWIATALDANTMTSICSLLMRLFFPSYGRFSHTPSSANLSNNATLMAQFCPGIPSFHWT